MRHVCGWCRRETAPPDGDQDELETTGICEDCLKTAKVDFDERMTRSGMTKNGGVNGEE